MMLILLQGFTHIIPLKLSGYTLSIDKVKLNLKNVSDGSYQDYLAAYATEKGGFREFFIRFYNQYLYCFYHEISNDNLIEGKNGEYYLKMYVDDVMGLNVEKKFSTIDSARHVARKNVENTLILIDSLQNHGTEFLVVFAPSKTAVYPEYMPDSIQEKVFPFSLQEYYIELFKEYEINHIDFLSYFKQQKGKANYPLYSRFGTHWAESTIPFVADSILRKMESMSGDRLAKIEYVSDNVSRRYSKQDGELENLMNLLFPLWKPAIPKPVFRLKDDGNTKKPNLLVIADSYFVQLHESCFVDAFTDLNYWKYNREVFSDNPEYSGSVMLFPYLYKVIDEADFVVVIFTSVFATDYLFGFYHTAMEAFTNRDSDSMEKEIQSIIERISLNPEWLNAVENQANENGVSLDEMLLRNAKYVLEMNKLKQRENS